MKPFRCMSAPPGMLQRSPPRSKYINSLFTDTFCVRPNSVPQPTVQPARVLESPSDGHPAVKVLRPGIDRRFKVDLEAFGFVARTAELWSAEARRLRLVGVIETLGRSVALEMDLRLEAAALCEMAENTRDDPDFRVPRVEWDYTARNVLTMEWIDGTPLSDRAALAARDLDLPTLGRALIQTFLRHALRDGFFHADMHPGNLFVDAEGRLVAVDFGIMGRLRPGERRYLAEILLGCITRDYLRIAEVHFEAGYVPAHHSVESFAQAIRAIGEPIHKRTAEDISMAKLLTLLFEVTSLFDMRTRPEALMLQKTMVVVEGMARTLDPRFDIWTTAEPGMDRAPPWSRWAVRSRCPRSRSAAGAHPRAVTARFAGCRANRPRHVQGGVAHVGDRCLGA
jgi:ubiquinone biosynthesis protein